MTDSSVQPIRTIMTSFRPFVKHSAVSVGHRRRLQCRQLSPPVVLSLNRLHQLAGGKLLDLISRLAD